MKRLLVLVAVAAVVGGGVWGYFYAQSRGSDARWRTVRAERGPLVAAVSATGNLNAVISVQVGSQVSGQIKDLLVDFNSVVKRNQVIARIDPAIFEAKVGQARAEVDAARAAVLNQQAQVERARADLENARAAVAEGRAQTAKARVAVADAKRDFDRKTELTRRDLIAKSDYDSSLANHDSTIAQLDATRAKEESLAAALSSAQAQLRVAQAMLDSARAQVKQKEAALEQAQLDLDHSTIRAPVDGVVVSRAVDVGQTVAASLQAPTLFTIAQDLTKMQVETSVDEADIGKIRVDGPATFTVDAFPVQAFSGRVTQIRKAAQVVQNVVTYTVVVAVQNPEGKLLPGMTANVKLVVAEKPSVLKISNAALRFRPPGAEPSTPGGPTGGNSSARPGAPAPPAGGRPSPEAIRDRLVKSLGLTAEQQAKLDPILQDSRQQMMALQGAPEQERQARAQRIREATRTRIRAILTPEQQARYDETAGAAAGGRGSGGVSTATTPGRVWVVAPDGKPQAVSVVLGLSDGSSTEVVQGNLREGQEVIVGVAGAAGRGPGGQTGGPRLRL